MYFAHYRTRLRFSPLFVFSSSVHTSMRRSKSNRRDEGEISVCAMAISHYSTRRLWCIESREKEENIAWHETILFEIWLLTWWLCNVFMWWKLCVSHGRNAFPFSGWCSQSVNAFQKNKITHEIILLRSISLYLTAIQDCFRNYSGVIVWNI